MVTEAIDDDAPDGRETGEPERRAGELSTFALDVYWASGRIEGTEVAVHVAACARCTAYLANLDALAAAAPPPRAKPQPLRAPRSRTLPLSTLSIAGGLALAASVALFARGARETTGADAGYVGIKGTPAVQLLIHRDQDTKIWDGRSPLRAGDALALRVACEGLKRVIVAAPRAPGSGGWSRLSEGACPAHDEPLPFTLRVDGEPGDERLAVVLSQSEIDDETLTRAITETRRAPDTWVVSFVMPKVTETNQ